MGTSENRGIAPSRKERALTPRCPHIKTYRAVTKRRGAYAKIPVLSVLSVPSVRTNVFIFGTNENRGIAPSQKEETLTPRCPRTKAYRAVAKRKSAYSAMPRLGIPPFSVSSVLTKSFVFNPGFFSSVPSLCSLCSLCETIFFVVKHANLKVGVPRSSQNKKTCQTKVRRSGGVLKAFPARLPERS